MIHIHSFRPLAGFWFLNCAVTGYPHDVAGFPSPCGVLVLKLASLSPSRQQAMCFRPLAGFWFLNWRASTNRASHCRRSFRPLAGFWFLNLRSSICKI